MKSITLTQVHLNIWRRSL